MPIILCEGIDGAGKSTLAERIKDQAQHAGLSATVWHRGIPTRHPLDEYEHDLEIHYDRGNDDELLICDRWALSQIVYGTVYPADKKDFSLGSAWHVDAFLRSRGAVQLILSPPLDVVRKRMAQRGETYLQQKDILAVHRLYEDMGQLFHRSVAVLREDLSDSDVQTLIQTAVARHRRARILSRWQSYVGPRYPQLLLVGCDMDRSEVGQQVSAYLPYRKTTGRWLCDAIANTELFDHRIGLIDIQDAEPAEAVARLRPAGVVTMGNIADQELTTLNIRHGVVPSPAWMSQHFTGYERQFATSVLRAAETNDRESPWLENRVSAQL